MSQIATTSIKTIRFVRHGQTNYLVKGIYQGHSQESHLTPAGILTAQTVGRRLKSQPIEIIYTSELRRAKETVDQIIKVCGYKGHIVNTPLLNERYMGRMEGLFRNRSHPFFESIEPLKSLVAKKTQMDPAEYTGEYERLMGVEPPVDILSRARQFMTKIINSPETQILVVSHGCLMQTLLNEISPTPTEMHNCEVKVVQYHPETGFTLVD